MTSAPRFALALAAALLLAAPGVLAGARFARDLDAARFDGDESWFIWFGRYYDLYFIERDLKSPEWSGPLAVDQPSLAKFVYGFATRTTGTADERPAAPWDFAVSAEVNVAQGRKPGPRALRAGRSVAAGFGVAAVAAATLAGALAGGTACGVAAGLLLALNPLLEERSRHATADSMLAFFLLASLAGTLLCVRSLRSGRLRAAVAFGALSGLLAFGAAGTKLNGALALAVHAGSVSIAAVGLLAERRLGAREIRAAALAIGLAAAVAAGLFALSNPVLLHDPVAGVRAFVSARMETLARQAMSTEWPLAPDERWGRLVRATLTGGRSPQNFVVLGRVAGVPVDAALAALGALLFLAGDLGLRPCRHPGRGLGAPVVLFAAVLYGATAPFLSLDWSRYFLPPVLGAALLVAGGAGAFPVFAFARIARGRPGEAADQSGGPAS